MQFLQLYSLAFDVFVVAVCCLSLHTESRFCQVYSFYFHCCLLGYTAVFCCGCRCLQNNESLLNNVCEERMTDYHVRYLPGILFTLIFILLCVALLCKLCFSLQNQSKFAVFLGYSFILYLYFQCYCCCVVLLASKNILVRSTRLYENVPACVTNYACCCCCCCCSYCCILLCFF